VRVAARTLGFAVNGSGSAIKLDLALAQHRRHGWNRRLDEGEVALVLQVVLGEHDAQRNVGAAAEHVGRHDLAAQVLIGLDRAVLAHQEFVAVVTRHPILKFVRDDAQIAHAGIGDGDREGREPEIGDLDLPDVERRDELRRSLEMHRFERVRLAEMASELRSLKQHRGPVGDRGDVGQTDFHWLGLCDAKAGRRKDRRDQNGLQAHGSLPGSRFLCR
jgi:hypothetical protein